MAAPPKSQPDSDLSPSENVTALKDIIDNPSEELLEVLRRADVIGSRKGEKTTISFTSVLLALLSSDTPSARWFQDYAERAVIDTKNMMSSQKVDAHALYDASTTRGMLTDLRGKVTRSAVKILRAAEELTLQTTRMSATYPHHVLGAYIYRCPPDHESQLAAWGFDRRRWSLDFLSYMASKPKLYERELPHWVEIHGKTFGGELPIPTPTPVTKGQTGTAPTSGQTAPAPTPEKEERDAPPDVTPLHLDNPADADYLGRRGFAEALAVRLRRVWGECNRPGLKTQSRSSFVLHLHGPWGSGKTSLLNFLKRELQTQGGASADAPEARGWAVIEFNAWQHQRISPPWWPLLDTVYARAVEQLGDDAVFGERGRAWRVRLRERWWRLNTGRRDYLLTAAFAFALAALLYWLTHSSAGSGTAEVVKSLVTYASVVVGVWSSVLLVSRSLLSGSARAAQSFMETAGDPMERVCVHFRELVGWVGRPVVVFLDDLDRCQPKYVVELLEGVQTLFSDQRVVYVVAADRRWLNTCFETTYQAFADAVKEPGRRLGSLFLEKAFELSISVPRLSDEMRQVYWDYLVGGGTQGDIERTIRQKTAEAESEFTGAVTEAQVLRRLQQGAGGGDAQGAENRDALRAQLMRSAAVRKLASRKAVASTEYFLKPFAPLLEPNPRAMKRLVNAYSVLRDMALLAGVDVLVDVTRRKQLALWAIVSLRWPLLQEYLENNPAAIDSIRRGRTRVGEAPIIADESLQKLAESEEVSNVFRGGETGTGLEGAVVSQIVGISAAQPTAASVA